MSNGKTTEDLNTSLANLMKDSFTCCIRNYEALLPYLEKKEIKLKIYHKLVQINILLNKLNEELLGLRVEYVTVSYGERSETLLFERGKKRKISDITEFGRHETKSIKTEPPFSSNAKCFIDSSKTGIDMHSDNVVSMGTEETHVQKLDTHTVENIKTEIQEPYEVEDFQKFENIKVENIKTEKIEESPEVEDLEFPVVSQRTFDSKKNTVTVSFVGNAESASMAGKHAGSNVYDKPSGTITQRENSEVCVPLQKVECQISNREKCETCGNVFSKDHDTNRRLGGEGGSTSSYQANRSFKRTYNKLYAEFIEAIKNGNKKKKKEVLRSLTDHVNFQSIKELSSAEDSLYGITNYKKGWFKCTLCDCRLFDTTALHGHVKAKPHRQNVQTAKKESCVRKFEIHKKLREIRASVSVCSDVPCSLAESVAIVEDRYQVVSMKHAVRLDDLWKYFDAPFHMNKKFFRIHSGQIMCFLCNELIGKFVLDVKKHISGVHHLHRIKILTNIELKNNSSNKQLLDIPGILKGIIPVTQFSLKDNGFLCSVCNCFCKNEVVLSHMTGIDHGKKLDEMKKNSVVLTTTTISASGNSNGK